MKNRDSLFKDILNLEHVHKNVSHQYVTIKTSEFVKTLEQYYKIKTVQQYRTGSSGHFVEMEVPGSNLSLYIENSFDRTIALRLSVNYKGFVFGRIKQIHKGKSATEITHNIDDIKLWFTHATHCLHNMQKQVLTRTEMQEIAQIAMKTRGVDLRMITNMNYSHTCALDFILYLNDAIKEGKLIRNSTRGPIVLKKVTQASLIVQINSGIWKYLSKNNPELYV